MLEWKTQNGVVPVALATIIPGRGSLIKYACLLIAVLCMHMRMGHAMLTLPLRLEYGSAYMQALQLNVAS